MVFGYISISWCLTNILKSSSIHVVASLNVEILSIVCQNYLCVVVEYCCPVVSLPQYNVYWWIICILHIFRLHFHWAEGSFASCTSSVCIFIELRDHLHLAHLPFAFSLSWGIICILHIFRLHFHWAEGSFAPCMSSVCIFIELRL